MGSHPDSDFTCGGERSGTAAESQQHALPRQPKAAWRQNGGPGGRAAALATSWRQSGGSVAALGHLWRQSGGREELLAAWRHGGRSSGGMAAFWRQKWRHGGRVAAVLAAEWRHGGSGGRVAAFLTLSASPEGGGGYSGFFGVQVILRLWDPPLIVEHALDRQGFHWGTCCT